MSRDVCLDDFPALRCAHVRIRDEAALLRTIKRILKDGVDSLQVVTDFDLTLTKQHVNGKKVLSSFGVFNKCKELPQAFIEESTRLYHKYRPLEIDPYLSLAFKSAAMDAWMASTETILRGIDLDPQKIPEVAKLHGGELRDGTEEMLKELDDAGVPVVVFSAGLGDVVEAIMRARGVLMGNVKLISNFLKYENGKITGFSNPRHIHVFNKSSHTLGADHFRLLAGRGSVILMGDTVGDAGMVDGVQDTTAVLKIGFLYDHVEESLESFMSHFDVVLIDDQTMSVPAEILRAVLPNKTLNKTI